MKANELMLGDYVTFADCQKDKYPDIIKIWQINEAGECFASIDGNKALDEIAIDDEIVGIPLTPEILEKNGFNARGYEELVLDTDEHCFALQKGVDGTNAWWWELFSSPIIPINHVHELQHALRLFKLEKEIEL